MRNYMSLGTEKDGKCPGCEGDLEKMYQVKLQKNFSYVTNEKVYGDWLVDVNSCPKCKIFFFMH